MMYNNYSGDYRAGVTPLPISNREVKLRLADGTTTAGLWESRSSPDFILKPQLSNQLRLFLFLKLHFPLEGGIQGGSTSPKHPKTKSRHKISKAQRESKSKAFTAKYARTQSKSKAFTTELSKSESQGSQSKLASCWCQA